MKINCIFHKDKTASLHIYEADGRYRCYGCYATGPLTEIPGYSDLSSKSRSQAPRENLNKSIHEILQLPTKPIRGFRLPYDGHGYYLVYPAKNYYLKRLWEGHGGNKYYGPKGHKRPLLTLDAQAKSDILFVVEGEFNALSLYASDPTSDVVSPGAATNLNSPEFLRHYLQYDKIAVIVDKDAAGVVAGIQLRDNLLKRGKRVLLHPMEWDLNEIYVTDSGKEQIKKEKQAIELLLGVSARM